MSLSIIIDQPAEGEAVTCAVARDVDPTETAAREWVKQAGQDPDQG